MKPATLKTRTGSKNPGTEHRLNLLKKNRKQCTDTASLAKLGIFSLSELFGCLRLTETQLLKLSEIQLFISVKAS